MFPSQHLTQSLSMVKAASVKYYCQQHNINKQ